jgi:hypothetical protein
MESSPRNQRLRIQDQNDGISLRQRSVKHFYTPQLGEVPMIKTTSKDLVEKHPIDPRNYYIETSPF